MTKPNAIEEIMARAMWEACRGKATEDHMQLPAWESEETNRAWEIEMVRYGLAALDAAGLAVVPKRDATDDQIESLKSAMDLGDYPKTAYLRAIIAFDPTIWKPKP